MSVKRGEQEQDMAREDRRPGCFLFLRPEDMGPPAEAQTLQLNTLARNWRGWSEPEKNNLRELQMTSFTSPKDLLPPHQPGGRRVVGSVVQLTLADCSPSCSVEDIVSAQNICPRPGNSELSRQLWHSEINTKAVQKREQPVFIFHSLIQFGLFLMFKKKEVALNAVT